MTRKPLSEYKMESPLQKMPFDLEVGGGRLSVEERHPFLCVYRGLTDREDNGTADLADMDELVNHYSRLFDKNRPFVQYETSRGCPNRCTFCTSSLDPILRYIPLEDVRRHLRIVQKEGINQKKN